MSEWQPIETAPRNGMLVDIWVTFEGRGRRYTDCHASDHNGWATKGGVMVAFDDGPTATHWMSAPQPPA